MDAYAALMVAIGLGSFAVQSAAAAAALRLIALTKRKAAWTFIAAALILMALRRLFSLYGFLFRGSAPLFWFDLTGLVLSLCMLIGIIKIRGVFADQLRSEALVRSLLGEKETMLREVHHRIKHNMITMGILLKNQGECFDDLAVRGAFADAQGRLDAMLVLYDKLYHSPIQSSVEAQEYIEDLGREILAILNDGLRIRFRVEAPGLTLKAGNTLFLGIILNELLTNAAKYAFCGIADPEIVVRMEDRNGRALFTVSDNGRGLPSTFRIDDSKGFGVSLVKNLTEQMGGSLKVGVGEGTRWEMEFKDEAILHV